jgi:hypothetical protein
MPAVTIYGATSQWMKDKVVYWTRSSVERGSLVGPEKRWFWVGLTGAVWWSPDKGLILGWSKSRGVNHFSLEKRGSSFILSVFATEASITCSGRKLLPCSCCQAGAPFARHLLLGATGVFSLLARTAYSAQLFLTVAAHVVDLPHSFTHHHPS